MRFRLTLVRNSRQKMIPMDYQYFISAWIYKVLKSADREFAQFLHDKGYGKSDVKLYKLFCFSKLDFGKPIMWKERSLFEITTREVSLKVSFDVPEAASNFIKGLFMTQHFYLGDKFNGIDLTISKVESLPDPDISETMSYKLETPWVISYKQEGRKQPKYLSPEDSMFTALAAKHLTEKYRSTREENIDEDQVVLKMDSNHFKRAGYLIKNETPEQTRVIGNIFDFQLTAPVNLHKMIWSAGISEKSSLGFGWVEMNKM